MMIDELELELRKLPGVLAAGFTERDEVLFIQLHISGEADPSVTTQAARIAYRSSEIPVAVELIRWKDVQSLENASEDEGANNNRNGHNPIANLRTVDLAPEPDEEDVFEIAVHEEIDLTAEAQENELRVRLSAVLTFPDTDELEVHATLGGQRSVGRSEASHGLSGAVNATLDALHEFVTDLPYKTAWVREVTPAPGEGFVVAVALEGNEPMRYGIASGNSPLEAAARATLQALNRSLVRDFQSFVVD